jgi:hypothetical protein
VIQDESTAPLASGKLPSSRLELSAYTLGLKILPDGPCQQCGNTGQLYRAPVMTCYADDTPENAAHLCVVCVADYIQYWNDMWHGYWASQGVG